jgi:hypothetical protein
VKNTILLLRLLGLFFTQLRVQTLYPVNHLVITISLSIPTAASAFPTKTNRNDNFAQIGSGNNPVVEVEGDASRNMGTGADSQGIERRVGEDKREGRRESDNFAAHRKEQQSAPEGRREGNNVAAHRKEQQSAPSLEGLGCFPRILFT